MELLRQLPRCPDPEVAEPVAGNYFVAAYPPFSCWSAEMAPAAHCQLDAPRPADAPFILYVHVPFCAHRCDYCYYLSTARHTRPQMTEYLADPLREVAGRGWLTFDRRAVALTRDGLLRADRLLTAFYLPEHSGVRYS